MSFTSEIKQEIAYNDLKECCTRAELSALVQLTSSLNISNHQLQLLIKSENPTTVKRTMLLMKKLYDVDTELRVYQKTNLRKNNIYELCIKDRVTDILSDLGIYSEKGLANYPVYEIVRKECCARAYLAGAFLAYGACNSPGKSNYHLEISMPDPSSCAFLIRQLKRFLIEAKSTQRRKRDLVYIKKADSISDFLRCIGAHESLMNFENIRIKRDFKNSVVRLGNCDLANAEKSMRTAQSQLEAIHQLEALEHFSPDAKIKEIIDLRKAYPEDSLAELCIHYEETYHQEISKSGLKHRLDKIMQMAKNEVSS